MCGMIMVLVKERGRKARLEQTGKSLESMEAIVGGTIEETWLSGSLGGIVMLTNLDAKELHKGSNFTLDDIKVKGTAVFCQSIPGMFKDSDNEYISLETGSLQRLARVFDVEALQDVPAKLL